MQNYSFKEIDQHFEENKGWAFKLFKAQRASLREGRDFMYLSAAEHSDQIANLKTTARIYASSVNAVLITASGLSAMGIKIVSD